MAFRVHIDIPLTDDKTQSVEVAQKVAEFLKTIQIEGVPLVQYRLSNDYDRELKNYLDINQNGHASTKKTKIMFGEEE